MKNFKTSLQRDLHWLKVVVPTLCIVQVNQDEGWQDNEWQPSEAEARIIAGMLGLLCPHLTTIQLSEPLSALTAHMQPWKALR